MWQANTLYRLRVVQLAIINEKIYGNKNFDGVDQRILLIYVLNDPKNTYFDSFWFSLTFLVKSIFINIWMKKFELRSQSWNPTQNLMRYSKSLDIYVSSVSSFSFSQLDFDQINEREIWMLRSKSGSNSWLQMEVKPHT